MHLAGPFSQVNTLAEINAVAVSIISEFGESAVYVSTDGDERYITTTRFDPYQREQMAGDGIGIVRPSFWVSVQDVPQPVREDSIRTSDDKLHRVIDVEEHRLRGYWRIFTEEQQ